MRTSTQGEQRVTVTVVHFVLRTAVESVQVDTNYPGTHLGTNTVRRNLTLKITIYYEEGVVG